MFRSSPLALTIAIVAAAPAIAQDEPGAPAAVDVYGGLSGGYHEISDNDFGDDGGLIGGPVLGIDVPVGQRLVLGVEGNFHLGTGLVDNEYGVAARAGLRLASGSVLYVRGGYQWVNFDLSNAISVDVDEELVDDTFGDYLVGVGGDFTVRDNIRLRVGVDTIAFDTIRPTVAAIVSFGR